MRNNKYIIKEDIDLLKFLTTTGLAKNKSKTYIKLGYIKVQNKVIRKLPYKLSTGDTLEINITPVKETIGFKIIFEDNNYLIVEKEAGLLTISTSNQTKNYEDTLYRRVRHYLNQKKEYAFIVNRIDKETSGLVLFSKNQQLKDNLQAHWNELVQKRGYIAIVSGIISKAGRIDNYLYEDKLTFTHSTTKGGKRAITNYTPIKQNKYYTMLDVYIETGRKNQIRVHLSEMHHPILGDKKYQSKLNPLKRLALHHYEISFIDPLTNKLLTFNSEVPHEFNALFN